MGWVTGCPLSYNHCQETQIELIKKLLIDIDTDDIYIVLECLEVCTHLHIQTYLYFRKIDVCLSSGGFQHSYTNLDMTLTTRQKGLTALYHLCYRQSLPDFYLSIAAVSGEVTEPSQLS